MEPLSRDRLLEEARNSGPLSGSRRVPHLVEFEAFERLLKDADPDKGPLFLASSNSLSLLNGSISP